ncbi:RDD family protein [Bacillus mojavensis]|uniref:RDD family protein n=1 Tax=Bacillus TaxID=1386 RepID=UPI000289D235|nr:RDD family protein [Bacillus mojavensis]MCY9189027.1 RDD family protein [Bacillus mojavensis]MDR4228953.1 RDD family protein [Bacillus mojavensis]MEC3587225.1 RDD family protein [Bacillus mojavensis]MEC5242415.1 RDD family protein [Bacillus mojavensis]MED0751035.1 RDD family protein [Bacillus mojavensis]
MNIYKPAGFWIRLGASLLDYIIVSVPLLLIYWLITGKDPNDSMIISMVVLLYSILLPVFWQGYLIGKRICGIRIVKKDGSQVGLVTMIMRVIIAALVYGITFGLGLIVSLFMIGLREDKRTLHDFIAGTYVTYAAPGEEELYTDEQIRKSE